MAGDIGRGFGVGFASPSLPEQLTRMGRDWGWMLATGIAYVILGLFAFSWPVASTFGVTFAIGILLVVSGCVQVVHSVRMRSHAGNGWRIVQAVLALAAGVLILRYPGAGMIGVAIALAFYFFMGAAAKWVVAAGLRRQSGWGWAFASALISFLLGAYILATFPFSALWVPGLVLGIDLVVLGASLVGFSFAVRALHRRAQVPGERPREVGRAA